MDPRTLNNLRNEPKMDSKWTKSQEMKVVRSVAICKIFGFIYTIFDFDSFSVQIHKMDDTSIGR